MKFFLVFSLWTGGPKRPAPPDPDPWFAVDKLEHFAASAIIQSWAHTTFRARGASYAQASWGAAASRRPRAWERSCGIARTTATSVTATSRRTARGWRLAPSRCAASTGERAVSGR